MARRRKQRPAKPRSVGGLAFWLGLAALLALSLINVIPALALLDGAAWLRWRLFIGGLIIGLWTALSFVHGRLGVFLHELKHAVLSNLAGNRARGMKIKGHSGHFRYEYTSATEQYNALIALAPYWLPLFSAPAFFLALLLPATMVSPPALLLLVGAAYGADLTLNLRDVSPAQTDLTRISGGYLVALTFVAAMNFVIFSYLAAWVSQGLFGMKFMVATLFEVVLHIFVYYRGL